jgi:hypothetical protein
MDKIGFLHNELYELNQVLEFRSFKFQFSLTVIIDMVSSSFKVALVVFLVGCALSRDMGFSRDEDYSESGSVGEM